MMVAFLLAAVFSCPLERVSTMDPALVQSAYDMRAVKLVYESMLGVDYAARPYCLVPGACELPDVTPDGRTYRFRLRSAALSADDVARAINRLRDPAVAAPNAYLLNGVEAVRTLDARCVEITLAHRRHVFPWMAASICVPRADGSGTGPFRLARWRKNHDMLFERRTPPPAGMRAFDAVRYLVVEDASTRLLMFLKGELDMLDALSRDNWDSAVAADGSLVPALAAAGVRLVETPTLDVMYFGINMRDRVLGPNRKLRQALNCAFDFPAWRTFSNGRVEPCDGPVPPGVAGRLTTPFPYAFDLARARRLLAEAGYPGGIDPATGRRLVLTLTIGRPDQESREAGEMVVSFYERIGIRLELDFMTWDAFLKALNESRVQLFRIGWVGDYPDAENFLQLFHSRNVSPGANHANYENPAFDREYDEAMAAPDEASRNRHWVRCQEIVREDCPWVFSHFPKAHALVRPRVGNFRAGAFPYGNEQYYEVIEP